MRYLGDELHEIDSVSSSKETDTHNTRIDVLSVIRRLPLRERVMLLSHYFGGLSLDEAAKAMRISIRVATKLLQKARENMMNELKNEDMSFHVALESSFTMPMLKEIFDNYADEMITEEQIKRVVDPIIHTL
ncbi:MAG: ECF-type sigma factor [Oscillospiraceae bacterium]|nr:ECF-type sigma factor [Oscillospiraceae bacterium]